jgi:1-phosphofructokinase family hexose kinase
VALPIVVATPNLSLDRTVALDSLELGHVHRSTRSDARGGGKGVNVARALSCIGVEATVIGIASGRTGEAVTGMIADEGLTLAPVRATGETRSCLTVLSTQGVTVFNESGPSIDAGVWDDFEGEVVAHLDGRGVFVCTGSFPPGSPETGAAALLAAAHTRGWATICDTSRAQLVNALGARPDIVAPNFAEAAAVLDGSEGEPVEASAGALARAAGAARALTERGPEAAVVTVGAAGAATHRGGLGLEWPAHDVTPLNPVGAGDCLIAGIASVLAGEGDFEGGVRRGMAMAAASCETFAAGDLDRSRYEGLMERF